MNGYWEAVSRYVRGDLEVEDFERALDALLAKDPDAIGQMGDPLPPKPYASLTDEPGAIFHYQPAQTVSNLTAILKEVYAIYPPKPDLELQFYA